MFKPRFSDRLLSLLDDPRASAWDIADDAVAQAVAGREVLFLTLGDPDFATAEPIIAEAKRALAAERTHYSPVAGEPRLRAAVARYQNRHGSVPTAVENVTIFPGAQNALFNIMQAVVGEGDEVIVPEPFYATYPAVVKAAGAHMRNVPCDPRAGFPVRAEEIASQINDRTRAVLINTPGNPTGSVISREEMEKIVELCRTHGLWLIGDEVYSHFVYEGTHVSVWEFADRHDRIAVANSVSKSLAMGGWRTGWSVTPADLASNLLAISTAQLFGSPQFVQDAVAWALDQDFSFISDMRQTYRERRDCVVGAVDRIQGMHCVSPEGGMFVFADVSAITPDARDFATRLLEEEGIAVVPGFGFGPTVSGHIRISLTQSVEKLTDAFIRISAFAARHQSRPERAAPQQVAL